MKAADRDQIHTPRSQQNQDLERRGNMLEVLNPGGNEN